MVECRIVDEWFVCRYSCLLLFVICMYVGWMSGLLWQACWIDCLVERPMVGDRKAYWMLDKLFGYLVCCLVDNLFV